MKRFFIISMFFTLLHLQDNVVAQTATTFTDSTGEEISLTTNPTRVVSLVPSVTEIIQRIGAEDALVGITYHSTLLPSAKHFPKQRKKAGSGLVGGFFSPSLEKIETLQPDVIFYADLQMEVVEHFAEKTTLINLSATSLGDSFEHITLLGKIFDREEKAAEIVAEEKRQLSVIHQKTTLIPSDKKQRVMRIMGRSSISAPGDDSFQNDYIRAAGGIAPHFGENGRIIPIDLAQWQEFNPQAIYGCGGDRQTLTFLDQKGWADVDALQNHRSLFFPCELTCRAASHTGYFVSWLAARIYGDEFSNADHYVLPERVVTRKALEIDLDYLQKTEIITSDIKDFRNKTLSLTFKKPMKIVSTLEGERRGISTIANHYFPPPSWGLGHKQGIDALKNSTLAVLGFEADSTAMLFTGANMDNLAVIEESYKKMKVVALVTAGVMGNGMRMGADTGSFYEPDSNKKNGKPGTINIMLLANMQLSKRAMTRAIISATEAKSASLQDMDIRSSYTPLLNPATGTGTDNIIVVEGAGIPIDSSGGHTKMGELIAKAVYAGVQQAVQLQNKLVTNRSVFQRLKERKISLHALSKQYAGAEKAEQVRKNLESILLQAEYASFLKAMMAISDGYEKGLIDDLTSVDLWCSLITHQLDGTKASKKTKKLEGLPLVLGKGIETLLAGANVDQNE